MEIRPHFEVRVALAPAAAFERVSSYLASPTSEVTGWVHGLYAELALRPEARHMWCPRLAVHVGDEDEDGTTLTCRLQPEPAVWTAYMAVWAVVIVTTMLVIGLGLSQLLRGQAPYALWYGIPGAGLAAVAAYGSALFGQRLSEHEVELLTSALSSALELSPAQTAAEPSGAVAG